jgi:hypothetical protein
MGYTFKKGIQTSAGSRKLTTGHTMLKKSMSERRERNVYITYMFLLSYFLSA